MGLCTDSLPQALALGLVLELFWIDSLRLGAMVPPTAALSFLLLYPLCLIFQWSMPEQVVLPLVVCILFSHASAWLENWHRSVNASHDARLELWAEDVNNKHGMSPQKILYLSHWRVLWSSALLYVLCFVVLYAFFAVLTLWEWVPVFSHVSWPILYGVGLLGAVLALRTRRAYVVLAFSVLAVLAWQALP